MKVIRRNRKPLKLRRPQPMITHLERGGNTTVYGSMEQIAGRVDNDSEDDVADDDKNKIYQ